MNISEMKLKDIDPKQIVRGFIYTAKEGLATREEILEKLEMVTGKLDDLNGRIAELEDALQRLDYAAEHQDGDTIRTIDEEYGSEESIRQRCDERRKERDAWANLYTQLEELLNGTKRFSKALCLTNIRELLRQNPDVKIGQIEKEAGVRIGYMSRLEKEGNTTEPSIEFILTAAKLLRVSLDTLVSVNLSGLTPTEQYIVSFFDKLKADTLADKLDWVRETPYNLNRIEPNYNGWVEHPLFDEETFFEESECEYPNEVTRIVFSSKSFGPKTYITGDCFNLRLKNGTTLYLMNIEKSVHRTSDPTAFAKEAWVYVPQKGCSSLLTTKDETAVAPMLEELYAIVKERMEHPKINKDVMYAIDSFMKDDLDDDDVPDLPFN